MCLRMEVFVKNVSLCLADSALLLSSTSVQFAINSKAVLALIFDNCYHKY